jgi:HEAT repeat protein
MAEQKLFDAAIALLKAEAGGNQAAAEAASQFPLDWLSDLSSAQAAEMARLWRRLPAPARRDLMGRMEEEARRNFEVDFLAVARIALSDSDPGVRVHAVRSFWECGDAKLVDRFLQILEQDPEAAVRASAATALGPFMERVELEELQADVGARIAGRLMSVIRGPDDLEVRRRAVESIGYASDPQVLAILENAYSHPEERMRVSALLAMGRSADSSFSAVIVEELRNPAPNLRAEAARAAGALNLRKSVPQLIELLEDVNSEVRARAIEALGEIGGEAAREALEKMQIEASGEEWELIETALENAEFQDSLGDLPLLDIDHPDEEEEESEERDDPE